MGRKQKYFTEEERKKANREKYQRYYKKNQEERKRKAREKYHEKYVKCKICGVLLKELVQHINKKHNITKIKYSESFPGAKLVSKKTSKNKATMTGRKRPVHSEFMSLNNPMKGKQRTIQEKELISKNRSGKGIGIAGKYIRTKEIREKISNSITKLYLNKKFNFNGGYYTSNKTLEQHYYRSSWELNIMKYLDFNSEIEWWSHEPFSIPYIDTNGINRNYIPDFLVIFSCGIKELWEVKPTYFLELDINICKLNGLNNFLNNQTEIDNGFVINENVLNKMKHFMKGYNDERIF